MTATPPPTGSAQPPTPSSARAAGQPRTTSSARPAASTTSLGARVSQVLMALVLAAISVMLLLATHRLEVTLLGIDLPAGLAFGVLFQIVISVFLWSSTGTLLPVLVLGCLWGMLATPFLGEGAGGGVMLPAMLGDVPQYQGWIVQGIGMGVPFLVAGVIALAARRRRRANHQGRLQETRQGRGQECGA